MIHLFPENKNNLYNYFKFELKMGLFVVVMLLLSQVAYDVLPTLNQIPLPFECSLDAYRNMSQIIKAHGFPAEEHTVTTKDGYILSVQRIPSSGPPVILQHGVLLNSAVWVFNNENNNSSAFTLAEAGYDVWLTNSRGSTYSHRHVTLSDEDEAFWNYSIDELGKYDLPAVIDNVLKISGYEQVSYVGHSLGTNIVFSCLIINPEYNSKIKVAILLAPTEYIGNMTSPVIYLVPFAEEIRKKICDYFSKIPAGISATTLVHYAQIIKRGKFCMYDYGEDNKRHYGQDTNPCYDLREPTTPFVIFCALNDLAVTAKDLKKLFADIENKDNIKIYIIKDPPFTHVDFVWGTNLHLKLNIRVLRELNKYYVTALN